VVVLWNPSAEFRSCKLKSERSVSCSDDTHPLGPAGNTHPLWRRMLPLPGGTLSLQWTGLCLPGVCARICVRVCVSVPVCSCLLCVGLLCIHRHYVPCSDSVIASTLSLPVRACKSVSVMPNGACRCCCVFCQGRCDLFYLLHSSAFAE